MKILDSIPSMTNRRALTFWAFSSRGVSTGKVVVQLARIAVSQKVLVVTPFANSANLVDLGWRVQIWKYEFS